MNAWMWEKSEPCLGYRGRNNWGMMYLGPKEGL